MKMVSLFLLFFYSIDSYADSFQCVGKKSATVLNELKFDFCLLKKKESSESQFIGVRLVRRNVSEQGIVLYVLKNSNHRLLFRLEQNKKDVFVSWPSFYFHSLEPYKEQEYLAINLKPGEAFQDEIFFSEIEEELVKSKADYNAAFRLSARFEYKYIRPGEQASARESERLRRAEILYLNLAGPNSANYEDIRIVQ